MQKISRRAFGGAATAMAALLLGSAGAQAQQLTVERIYGSRELSARSAGVRFLDAERAIVFERGEETTDVWLEGIRSRERERILEGRLLVPPGSDQPIAIEGLELTPDRSRALIFTNSERVWRQNTKGTYFVYDFARGELIPTSPTEGMQMFAKLSPDGRQVGFVRDNDLYVTDLVTGEERRLTTDGSEDIINGTTDWVYEEELSLRDAWRWSPDGSRILFWRFDQSPIRPFFMIDDMALYAEPVALRYPKAGTRNSVVELRVIELATGEVRALDVGDDEYIARADFAGSADEAVVQTLNRHQNRLTVRMADVPRGTSRVLLTETDSAWVDVDDDLTWVDGGRRFLWSSERDGYNHLYLYDRDGSLVRQVTRGAWDVTDLACVDSRNGRVFFTATEQGPTERHLYRTGLDGRGVTRITQERGTHRVSMNPTCTYYTDSHSSAGVPPTTRLHSADGRAIRTLADNDEIARRIEQMDLPAPEFFTFRTTDGVRLNGYMIKPADFDESRRYPVLMYVYGGPGSQTVTDAWGGARYLWHHLLAERGVLVVSIDNRGTGGRGRDFRKLTYLELGRWETNDQIEGARHLAALPYVDPERIGIWGWSYGGYMTALSMMNGDVFRAGVSVAPVTDWRLYDTIYTERFMRTPEENEAGYDASSPVSRAAQLDGRLLLIHGTGDDNVHFQNSVQLTDALQAAGKQFDFMLYANRTHSISGGNTSVHLFEYITEWIMRNLAH